MKLLAHYRRLPHVVFFVNGEQCKFEDQIRDCLSFSESMKSPLIHNIFFNQFAEKYTAILFQFTKYIYDDYKEHKICFRDCVFRIYQLLLLFNENHFAIITDMFRYLLLILKQVIQEMKVNEHEGDLLMFVFLDSVRELYNKICTDLPLK